MALEALSRDTFKQQRLDALLRTHGHPEGWRTWLLEQRARGLTVHQLSGLIQQLGLTVDPTTVLLWIKQAITEESRKPGGRGPEAPAVLRANTHDTRDDR